MKKILIIFVIFVFITACTKEAAEEKFYVKYIKVKPETKIINSIYKGYVSKGGDIYLSFNLSGIINGFYVSEGKKVKKGDIIAKLDTKEYEYNLSKAEFELEDTKNKYKRIKSYYERISKLHDAGGISYNDWEEAGTNLKSAINKIKIAKDAYNIAKEKEAYTKIISPDDGEIIKTFKDNLEYVNAGEKVVLFQKNGLSEAKIFIPQNKINLIKKNQIITLQTDAIKNKTYSGKVKSKVNSSENQGSYVVTISIDNNPLELLDGMSVNVKLKEKEIKGIFIPVNSIFVEEDKKYVFLLNPENMTSVKKEIMTGEIYGDETEVLKGLDENALLITKGINKLSDNSKVYLKNERSH